MTPDQCLHLACTVAMSVGPGEALTMPIAKALMEAVACEREACAAIADRWAEVYISSANVAAEIRLRTGS